MQAEWRVAPNSFDEASFPDRYRNFHEHCIELIRQRPSGSRLFASEPVMIR
jgi:hypothetical protein